jgi:hypothetical protein
MHGRSNSIADHLPDPQLEPTDPDPNWDRFWLFWLKIRYSLFKNYLNYNKFILNHIQISLEKL